MKHSLEVTKVYKDFLDSPAGGAVDEMMSILPPVAITWGMMKNAIEGTENMRILRGLGFFEGLTSDKFQTELSKSEQALDGLAICFEAYIKQRNKNKRKIIKNIFLSFIQLSEKEKDKFELERLLDITDKISYNGIEYLSFIKYFILDLNKDVFGGYEKYSSENIENIFIYDTFSGRKLKKIQRDINIATEKRFKLFCINNTLGNLENEISYDNIPKRFREFISESQLDLEEQHKTELSSLGLLRLHISSNKNEPLRIEHHLTTVFFKFISYILEDEKY